jgi:hypothetical protein
MFRAQRLLLDPERPLEQGYRLVVLALVKPEPAVVGDGLGHGRMVRAQGLFLDLDSLGVELFGLGGSLGVAVEVGQVVLRLPDAFVILAFGALADVQGAQERFFCGLETLQSPVQVAQPVEGLGQAAVFGAEGLFPDRQRPGVEILGFRIPANLAVNVGQVVKRLPDAFVFRPLAPLANGQGLLEDLFRLLETAQFPI